MLLLRASPPLPAAACSDAGSSPSDPNARLPLAAWSKLTGFKFTEVANRSNSFLQGPHTEAKLVERMRAASEKGETTRVRVVNYDRYGTPFYNSIEIFPLRDMAGKLTHYCGVLQGEDIPDGVVPPIDRHAACARAAARAEPAWQAGHGPPDYSRPPSSPAQEAGGAVWLDLGLFDRPGRGGGDRRRRLGVAGRRCWPRRGAGEAAAERRARDAARGARR